MKTPQKRTRKKSAVKPIVENKEETIVEIVDGLDIVNVVESLVDLPNVDWGLKAINAPKVWSKTKGEGVKVLVMDTGVDVKHDDLNVLSMYNSVNRSKDVNDESGHGTHVAGLIAGKNTGVAPNVELHVIKVLNDNERGSMASVMDGITYAINYGMDVLCISLGTKSKLPLNFQERVEQANNAGVTIVCATGNNGENIANHPASLNDVIAVGGLDKNLKVASFSNGGHDVLAPAVGILSTHKGGKYASMTGTSMASPLVAGGIALLISHYRNKGQNLTPKEIKEMLKGLENGIFDLTKLID